MFGSKDKVLYVWSFSHQQHSMKGGHCWPQRIKTHTQIKNLKVYLKGILLMLSALTCTLQSTLKFISTSSNRARGRGRKMFDRRLKKTTSQRGQMLKRWGSLLKVFSIKSSRHISQTSHLSFISAAKSTFSYSIRSLLSGWLYGVVLNWQKSFTSHPNNHCLPSCHNDTGATNG